MDLDQNDLDEIASLIREGNTSGILDADKYQLSFELKVKKWTNDIIE